MAAGPAEFISSPMSTVEFRPSPALLKIQRGVALVPPLFIGTILAFVFWRSHLSLPLGFAIGFVPLAALSLVYTTAFFHTIHYSLDDRHLTISRGLVWKMRRATPLDKITNVDVRQGPLERMHGMGQVWVYTPSTGSLLPEVLLVGVENPLEMKMMITARADAAKARLAGGGSSAGDVPEDALALLRQIARSLAAIEAALVKKV
jgi:membrane protein YdbS with pleckstrin-like domain